MTECTCEGGTYVESQHCKTHRVGRVRGCPHPRCLGGKLLPGHGWISENEAMPDPAPPTPCPHCNPIPAHVVRGLIESLQYGHLPVSAATVQRMHAEITSLRFKSHRYEQALWGYREYNGHAFNDGNPDNGCIDGCPGCAADKVLA